jgi:hypothetical protein
MFQACVVFDFASYIDFCLARFGQRTYIILNSILTLKQCSSFLNWIPSPPRGYAPLLCLSVPIEPVAPSFVRLYPLGARLGRQSLSICKSCAFTSSGRKALGGRSPTTFLSRFANSPLREGYNIQYFWCTLPDNSISDMQKDENGYLRENLPFS